MEAFTHIENASLSLPSLIKNNLTERQQLALLLKKTENDKGPDQNSKILSKASHYSLAIAQNEHEHKQNTKLLQQQDEQYQLNSNPPLSASACGYSALGPSASDPSSSSSLYNNAVPSLTNNYEKNYAGLNYDYNHDTSNDNNLNDNQSLLDDSKSFTAAFANKEKEKEKEKDEQEKLEWSRQKPKPIWRPPEWCEWDRDRQKRWDNLSSDPNGYYYRYPPPGYTEKTTPWTLDEKKRFRYFIVNNPLENKLWGLFSFNLPGRPGYQCEKLYKELKDTKTLSESENNKWYPAVGSMNPPDLKEFFVKESLSPRSSPFSDGHKNKRSHFTKRSRSPQNITSLSPQASLGSGSNSQMIQVIPGSGSSHDSNSLSNENVDEKSKEKENSPSSIISISPKKIVSRGRPKGNDKSNQSVIMGSIAIAPVPLFTEISQSHDELQQEHKNLKRKNLSLHSNELKNIKSSNSTKKKTKASNKENPILQSQDLHSTLMTKKTKSREDDKLSPIIIPTINPETSGDSFNLKESLSIVHIDSNQLNHSSELYSVNPNSLVLSESSSSILPKELSSSPVDPAISNNKKRHMIPNNSLNTANKVKVKSSKSVNTLKPSKTSEVKNDNALKKIENSASNHLGQGQDTDRPIPSYGSVEFDVDSIEYEEAALKASKELSLLPPSESYWIWAESEQRKNLLKNHTFSNSINLGLSAGQLEKDLIKLDQKHKINLERLYSLHVRETENIRRVFGIKSNESSSLIQTNNYSNYNSNSFSSAIIPNTNFDNQESFLTNPQGQGVMAPILSNTNIFMNNKTNLEDGMASFSAVCESLYLSKLNPDNESYMMNIRRNQYPPHYRTALMCEDKSYRQAVAEAQKLYAIDKEILISLNSLINIPSR